MDDAPARESSDAEETRARILEAAQQIFAEIGYAQVSIRQIAAAARVAPSLVIHYFGNKERLFEEAFRTSLDLGPMLSLPRTDYGRGLVALLGETNTDTVRSSAMLAQSIGSPQSRDIAIKMMDDAFIEPLSAWLSGPHANGRARLIAMMTLGFSTLRNLLPIGHPDLAEDEFVTVFLAEALQRLADLTDEKPNG